MADLTPEMFDMLEQIRQSALSHDDSEEYFPWGTRTFSRGLRGNNFLFVLEQKRQDGLEVLLRLPTATATQALEQPFVERHKSMGFKGWLTVTVKEPAELEMVLPWIAVSYALSKPVRQPDEVVAGENPTILAMLDTVRQAAMSYGDIEEFFPYGSRAFRRLKGQIFLYASEGDDCLNISVRLPLGVREYALGLPFVSVPKYIGPKGWLEAKVSIEAELQTVLPWIDFSFEMNKPARRSKAK